MTKLEITAREKRIVDHIAVIIRRHPGSAARREALAALIERLDRLNK